jgi:hypothetical protein
MLHFRRLGVITFAVLLSSTTRASITAQTPVGTAFSYQGRLSEAGSATNGLYDFQFTLYGASSGGSAIGASVEQGDVAVSGGVFTVLIDFGASAFNGDARWLEVAVRPGASGGAYTTISPRQRLSPTPYSLEALQFGGRPPEDYALADDVVALASEVAAVEAAVAGLSAATAKLAATQTFTGTNTFSNGSNFFSGTVQIGTVAAACDAAGEGTVRYDSASKQLEFCDGTAWRALQAASQIK